MKVNIKLSIGTRKSKSVKTVVRKRDQREREECGSMKRQMETRREDERRRVNEKEFRAEVKSNGCTEQRRKIEKEKRRKEDRNE